MKLIFRGHDARYAVEQSLLAFFPRERPVYDPEAEEENQAVVALSQAEKYTTAVTTITYNGAKERGSSRVIIDPAADEYEKERLRQRAVKLSFFKAAQKVTGVTPTWGALTGIRPAKLAAGYLEQGMSPRQVNAILRDTYSVSPVRRELCIEAAQAGLKAKGDLKPEDISLYIGIPFCPTRCAYCSFVSQAVEKSFGLMEPYLEALLGEITRAARTVRDLGLRVKSFYMGGGTPTTLSADQMNRLLTHLNHNFDLSGCAEYCIEAGRPDTIDREKLQVLLDHGCNRISVNPQSLEDGVLQAIGRRHTAADIEKTMDLAMSMGFRHVNMDLIAGLPGDTVEGFERSLRQAIALDPENITVHTLTLKRASRIVIEDQRENDYADVAAMLERCHLLAEAGYRPYYLYRQKNTLQNLENVGWCKPGHEGYYNIYIMEEVQTILSAGAGGSTKLVADGGKRMQRIFNFKYPTEYIQRFAEVLERKKGVADFYDHDLGPETSGGDRPL